MTKQADARRKTALWKRIEKVFPDDSVVEKQRLYDMLSPESKAERHQDMIDHWNQTLHTLEAVTPLVQKGRKFDRGPKNDRFDNLGKAMKKAWTAFLKEHGRFPTAFEVYDWIPEEGIILEKDMEQKIHWKKANGKETETTYKAFLNRYTALKQKLTSK